jgi:hypothetical protein
MFLVAASVAVGGITVAKPGGNGHGNAFGHGNNPGHNGSGGPGNSGLFKPGKGCGDKNHIHYRENECKKPPK